MYEIIDDNGVIHSGSEEEMYKAFDVMTNSDEYSKEDIDYYGDKWEGDLKLIQVLLTAR